MILAEVEEVENVGVPGLDVDAATNDQVSEQSRKHAKDWHSRKGTRTLVASLVDVAGGGVIRAEHGNNTIRVAVGASNVRALGADIVDVETDSTGCI